MNSDNHYYWVLDGHRPVPCDMLTWARWYEEAYETRRVAETFTVTARVSTVFMGLNHNWGGGPPILFETMAFDRVGHEVNLLGRSRVAHRELDQVRSATWDEALLDHEQMVREIQEREAAALGQLDRVVAAPGT